MAKPEEMNDAQRRRVLDDNRDQRNLHQQGRQGNTHQNTTHQGYQQDR